MERVDEPGQDARLRNLELAVRDISGEIKGWHDQREERRADLKEIRGSLQEIKLRMAAMPDTEHKAHHDFVRLYIEEHQQRMKARAAILEKIASGGIWAAITGVAALIWLGLKAHLGA